MARGGGPVGLLDVDQRSVPQVDVASLDSSTVQLGADQLPIEADAADRIRKLLVVGLLIIGGMPARKRHVADCAGENLGSPRVDVVGVLMVDLKPRAVVKGVSKPIKL